MSQSEFQLSVPAEASHLKEVRAFFLPRLREHFGDEADMLVLALDEACSNILKHQEKKSAGECLTVDATIDAKHVRFRVRNFCCREDVPKIRPRDLKCVRPGGLGTHFIHEIMDRVEFEPDPGAPGRLSLVLEKSRSGAGGRHGS
jgi:anti-sigma regulatory factor (Ser/Thr protein kinase)